jgi:hypothetical protein
MTLAWFMWGLLGCLYLIAPTRLLMRRRLLFTDRVPPMIANFLNKQQLSKVLNVIVK